MELPHCAKALGTPQLFVITTLGGKHCCFPILQMRKLRLSGSPGALADGSSHARYCASPGGRGRCLSSVGSGWRLAEG